MNTIMILIAIVITAITLMVGIRIGTSANGNTIEKIGLITLIVILLTAGAILALALF
jgi:hypothetical protein